MCVCANFQRLVRGTWFGLEVPSSNLGGPDWKGPFTGAFSLPPERPSGAVGGQAVSKAPANADTVFGRRIPHSTVGRVSSDLESQEVRILSARRMPVSVALTLAPLRFTFQCPAPDR
jgi:hypothetical protein